MGKSIAGLTAISFEVQAKGVAKIKMEMVGKVEIEGNFILGEYERKTKEEIESIVTPTSSMIKEK